MSSAAPHTQNDAPAAQQTAMARIAATMNSEATSSTMLILFAALFLVAMFVTLPLIYVHMVPGRIKRGWTLKTYTGDTLQNASRTNSPPSTIKNSPQSSRPKLVRFRQLYNKFFLRVIPFVNLTIGQFLILLVIFVVFLFGCLNKNLATLRSNYKRPGWVAATLLPLVYILAMKNTPLGLLGKGYECVNYIHRFISRLLIIAVLVHAFSYFHLKLSSGGRILFGPTVVSGAVALLAFLIILISSFKPIRSRFYQTFVVLHVLSYLTVLVALVLHVKVLIPYVAVAVAALVIDLGQVYLLKTRLRSASLTTLPGQVTKVEVNQLGDGWHAGQHVYLRVMKGASAFQKHPFTIANAPASTSSTPHNNKLILIAKATGDYTKAIYSIGLATQITLPTQFEKVPESDKYLESFPLENISNIPVAIEGPYGSLYTDMSQYETVLFVAGGSGFSWCMANIEETVGQVVRGEAITRTMFIIWTVRDIDMAQPFSKTLNDTIEAGLGAGLEVIFNIHLTTQSTSIVLPPTFHSKLVQSRVDLTSLIQTVLERTDITLQGRGDTVGNGIGIGICGPRQLVTAMRNAVCDADSTLASKVGGLSLHTESFDW
ncbi:hypothetical protein DFH28DRAFT_599657 [Melampsora americana]|nr:hypothetical protein DFH28DRAFT_599657 [Melampsora americana]